MRRMKLMLVTLAAAALGGCAYNPYTGTYEPCCAYPYGAYAYPPPAYGQPPGPYGAPGQPGPDSAPPQGQPGPYGAAPPPGQQYGDAPPPPGQPGGPPPGGLGAPPPGAHQGVLAQRFAAANVAHDGRLTREQAAAGMPWVAQQFDAIDVQHRGFVTLPEIRHYLAQRRAQGAPPG